MVSPLESDVQFEQLYRDYIGAVNSVSGPSSVVLRPYLSPSVIHNNKELGIEGYTKLIHPGSDFRILHLVASVEQGIVAARLKIIFTDGSTYMEHVFYQWDTQQRVIKQVWSMVEGPERRP